MLTQARLKHLLSYNPDTGIWIWINAPLHNRRRNEKPAGSVSFDGRRRIRIGGQGYLASRLAFLYMTGEWPKDEVDHIDRDQGNDRWSNLREATSSENKFNRSPIDGYQGYRGVYACKRKWQAQAGGVYLGVFDTLEEALTARDAAASQIAGNFAVLNRKDIS